MLYYAIKMMVGDKGKFLGILIGLIFSTFIITQQAGIFTGLMLRTFGFVTDTSQGDVWVMDKQVQYIDDIKTIKFSNLFRVKSIDGVEWAVPIAKGLVKARLTTGHYQTCNVIGIDDATLIGGSPYMVTGALTNLRRPNSVIIDDVGAEEKLDNANVGTVFELNDRRAIVAGVCHVTRTFLSEPVVYTTFTRAVNYSPGERNYLSFILVKAKKGVDPKQLARTIRDHTGLAAYTNHGFKKMTILYYIFNTGILVNFGFAVFLGVVIGAAIAGQTFFNFAHDNRHFFATLKAMGATKKILRNMVVAQASFTALISWGIGLGITTLFGFSTAGTELAFTLPIWLFLGSGVTILSIAVLSAIAALYQIIRQDPAIMFAS